MSIDGAASESPSSRERVNTLDLLRFVAALAVVIFHYAFRGYAADGLSPLPYPLLAPIAQYGFLGVELFFLISGFVILMSAAGGRLRAFVISRAVRLYPAFWACCTLTFLAIVAFGGERFNASFGQYLVNLTLFGGIAGVRPIDGVYWSLFVEMTFYGMIAVVLLTGLMHRAQTLLLLWLAATIALTVVPVGALRALLISDYAPYFIGGAMAYLIWESGVTPLRVGAIVVTWLLALVQTGQSLAEIEQHYATAYDRRVVATIVTTLFVVMILVATRRTGFLGRRRWLALGALTYPLYLLHQVIGYIIFTAGYPTVNPHLLFWGTLVLMLLVAHGMHRLVERPLGPWLKRLLNAAFDVGIEHAPGGILKSRRRTADDPDHAVAAPPRASPPASNR